MVSPQFQDATVRKVTDERDEAARKKAVVFTGISNEQDEAARREDALKGKPLATQREAAIYITKLPKAEHDTAEWLARLLSVWRAARKRFHKTLGYQVSCGHLSRFGMRCKVSAYNVSDLP
jgi:hypothetical protein